jgi:hypothetical protein
MLAENLLYDRPLMISDSHSFLDGQRTKRVYIAFKVDRADDKIELNFHFRYHNTQTMDSNWSVYTIGSLFPGDNMPTMLEAKYTFADALEDMLMHIAQVDVLLSEFRDLREIGYKFIEEYYQDWKDFCKGKSIDDCESKEGLH